ncbi:MAG: protein translocase subunit SecD [Candidatus Nealsonbacteria bacterium]|nr:protein translocase subunit SecD [Candidatus Nealsonbacteria bacterium]
MSKNKTYLTILGIFILTFFAGNLVYPQLLKLNWLKEIPFKLGLDLQGGTHLVYQADLSKIEASNKSESMEGLRDVIEKRVNFFGVKEPVIQVQGERLIVELAGVINPAEAIAQIGKTPFLEFKEYKSQEIIDKIAAKQKEIEGKTEEEIKKIDNWEMAYEDPFQSTDLTGKYLEKAEVGFDQTTYQPQILLQFNEEGAKIFEEITGRNIGKPLAVYLDYQLTQAPMVNDKISGGKAEITGNFTVEEAKTRVRELNSGALPVPINLISQQSVGPTLGVVSLESSLKAGLWGFLSVVLFMIIVYRFSGLLASLALVIYAILVLASFKIISVTLTLAGIGGLILSIGMAVDANVLIFARMKEERKSGKNFSQSIEDGFNRAWPSIRDGNFTTLIVAAILFGFGSSFVKGFALTLSLGILISMFSAIVITKNFLKLFVNTILEKNNWIWG